MTNTQKLSIRQRSNIRLFAYYLVNGTLDFDLLNNQLSVEYHGYLKTHPELFFKACFAFINLECKYAPNWPHMDHLGGLISQWIEPERFSKYNEPIETDCRANPKGLKEAFLAFSHRFSIGQADEPFIAGINYADFISDGATNVETCFAIWANVIEFENGVAVNQEYAISRVLEYLKMYYGNGYQAQLEDWEWELYLYTDD